MENLFINRDELLTICTSLTYTYLYGRITEHDKNDLRELISKFNLLGMSSELYEFRQIQSK